MCSFYIALNPRYSMLRALYIITPVNGSVCTQFLLNSLGSIQFKLQSKALQGYHSHVHLILPGTHSLLGEQGHFKTKPPCLIEA